MRLLPLLLLVVLLGAQTDDAPVPVSTSPAASDTLRYTLGSGEALVAALPGDAETTYEIVRAPALSWLVGRSFFWQTVPAERGREFVILTRDRDGRGDTLVLVIDVGTE